MRGGRVTMSMNRITLGEKRLKMAYLIRTINKQVTLLVAMGCQQEKGLSGFQKQKHVRNLGSHLYPFQLMIPAAAFNMGRY